jgi:hypothetical protein
MRVRRIPGAAVDILANMTIGFPSAQGYRKRTTMLEIVKRNGGVQ